MTSGHLSEKNGYYYAVLSYTDALGKRKSKWIATGLPVKGNKKKAEEILAVERMSFIPPERIQNDENILFADFMEYWLEVIKSAVTVVTYSSYSTMVKGVIIPYFREKKIKLKDLTAKDIQEFYLDRLKHVKANSVIHYHSNIHKALKYAVQLDMIPANPADKVERPKKEPFIGSFNDADEMKTLLEACKGTKLEMPIMLAAFYGLRRSEALGLKWDAVDFDRNTITIKHTVTECSIDGKYMIVKQDRTKTKSSMRTLPLVGYVRECLIELMAEQDENRRLCGKSYIKDYDGYICVNEIGDIIKPGYVTNSFGKLLTENGLRKIRFHDLRHPYVKHTTKNISLQKQKSQTTNSNLIVWVFCFRVLFLMPLALVGKC